MKHSIEIPEPKVARFLFADTRFAWVWLILRVYVGWQWLTAGWGKITSPAWIGPQAGGALQGFLSGSVSKATGSHPDVSAWYAFFVTNVVAQHAAIFSFVVAYGEFLVGLALILGVFVGIASFFGAFMNFNYLFAGTVSINPLLLLIEIFLILAWRTAGWWGIDRWLLPAFGVPWKPGKIFRGKSKSA